MQAIMVSRFGGPEVLIEQDLPSPRPATGEVLVQVEAAGVNFHDVMTRRGLYPNIPTPPIPAGLEGAGTVIEVGDDVTGTSPGDRVAWATTEGSYAELVCVRADCAVPIPSDVSALDAAALLAQGLTAHYLATDAYAVQAGDIALVHAASGGVGRLLTQFVTLHGGQVLATVSDLDKARAARTAGAEDVVTYQDLPAAALDGTDGRGVDVVYDSVGGTGITASLAALRRRGTLVAYGASGGEPPPMDLRQFAQAGSVSVIRPRLADFIATREELLSRAHDLFRRFTKGQLTLQIAGVWPLAQAKEAHRALESRTLTGKLLLQV